MIAEALVDFCRMLEDESVIDAGQRQRLERRIEDAVIEGRALPILDRATKAEGERRLADRQGRYWRRLLPWVD